MGEVETSAAITLSMAAPKKPATFKLLWRKSLEKVRDSEDLEDGVTRSGLFRFPEAAQVVHRAVLWKKCLAHRLPVANSRPEACHLHAIDFLTEAWLSEAVGHPVASFEAKSIGEGLGFLSMTFRIRLKPASAAPADFPSSLILKVPGCYEEGFEIIAEETDCYTREHQFYTTIVPILDEFARSRPNFRKIWVPRVWRSEVVAPSGARILMEDLGTVGHSVNQLDGLEVERVRTLVTMAAGLHATFWQESPQALAIPEQVVRADDDKSFIKRWNTCFLQRYDEVVETNGLEVYRFSLLPEQVVSMAEKINRGAAKILKRVCYQSPQTLIHADYRADNLIMLPGEDCAVLDWQLCSTGPGVYDLVDVITKSMTADNGAKHCRDLLQTYHKALMGAGVRDYSWEDLWTDYGYALLAHACLVFAIGLDGIGTTNSGERALLHFPRKTSPQLTRPPSSLSLSLSLSPAWFWKTNRG